MLLTCLKSFIALFIVIDPVGNMPVFLAVTRTLEGDQRRRALTISVFVSFGILLIFAMLGEFILNQLFQINLADIRIAGGILLFIISIQHLLGGDKAVAATYRGRPLAEEIGCVPLACPLLAGPGAMVASLTIWHDTNQGPVAALTGIVLVLTLFWVLMRFVDTINRVVGKLIITAISKVMLVFLAAFGVNMIMQGVLAYFP